MTVRLKDNSAQTLLSDALANAHKAPFTLSLLVLAVLVFFQSQQGQDLRALDSWLLASSGSYGFENVANGEIWRLWSPLFVHFGIQHLLPNALVLFLLASGFEREFGSGRLALFVVIAGLYSNVAQFAVAGSVYFGGLSGIGFALFGYLLLQGRGKAALPDGFAYIAWLSFFGCFVMSAFGIPVANTAHAAGLAVGLVWGLHESRKRRKLPLAD